MRPAWAHDRDRRRRAGLVCGLAVGAALALIGTTAHAHKAVTSRYTYSEDVFPILRDKCGRCHAEGGAAPMSLLQYKDASGGAVAWAESMREMLVSLAMPPWYADPAGPGVRNNHRLTPRELDVLVTWATGGTPLGDPGKKLSAPAVTRTWPLGRPDVELPMPASHELGPGIMNDTADFALPTTLPRAAWLKAADLLPGSQLVRRAEIGIENGPVLAVWEPGDDAAAAPPGSAFRLPPAATIHLRIFYKKAWQDERQTRSDRSIVGLYFADPASPIQPIESVPVDALEASAGGTAVRQVRADAPGALRILAVRPSLDQPYAALELTAILPSNERVTVLKLRGARPEWPRRYWLTDPVVLPAGSALEVKAAPGDPDSGPLGVSVSAPFRIALDVTRK